MRTKILCILMLFSTLIFAQRSFTPDNIKDFLSNGSYVVVDSQYSRELVLEFIQQGQEKVVVDIQGFSNSSVKEIIQFHPQGKFFIPGTFSNKTIEEFLQQGIFAAVGDGFSESTVHKLIAIAGERLEIYTHSKAYSGEAIKRFLARGAHVVVGNGYSMETLGEILEFDKDHATFYLEGHSPKFVLNFIQQGAKVVIGKGYSEQDVLEFLHHGGQRVDIRINGYSNKSIENFVQHGAKIILGENSSKAVQKYSSMAGDKAMIVCGLSLFSHLVPQEITTE